MPVAVLDDHLWVFDEFVVVGAGVAKYLIRFAGMSQREIADYLAIGSGFAVCNQLRGLDLKLQGVAGTHLYRAISAVRPINDISAVLM